MPAFVSLLTSFDLLPWEPRTVAAEPQIGFIARVVIGGLNFYAIAMPVKVQKDGIGISFQEPLAPENETELQGLYAAWEPGSPFVTAQVKGYDCVVTFQPFAQ